jgi:hypothetical protein
MNPKLQHNAVRALLGLIAPIALLGCDEALPSMGDSTGESTPSTAAGEFALVTSEPVVFAGKGNPKHFELVADSHFEAFGAGPTPEWQESERRWQQMAGAPESTDVVEENGASMLSLRPDPKGIELRQSIADLGPVSPNDWLVATMRGKADSPYTLGLVITFKRDGARVEAAEGHPGDGQWHEVRLAMPVPDGLTQNVFDCSVVYVGNPTGPASVEWARVRLEPRDGADADNLALNGGFERYRFTRLPYPWQLDRWNSLGKPVEGGDALIVPASGEAAGAAALSFTRPGEGTNVRISQRVMTVTRNDAGAKLVATAMGKASHDQELWMQLRCTKNGRDANKTYVVHPGDGAWHELSVELTVQADTAADTVYVDVFRRSYTDAEVLVDNVRVERR